MEKVGEQDKTCWKKKTKPQIFTAEYKQEVHKHITLQRVFNVVGRKISLEKCARDK